MSMLEDIKWEFGEMVAKVRIKQLGGMLRMYRGENITVQVGNLTLGKSGKYSFEEVERKDFKLQRVGEFVTNLSLIDEEGKRVVDIQLSNVEKFDYEQGDWKVKVLFKTKGSGTVGGYIANEDELDLIITVN